jgi:hypothetical protein
MSAILDTATYDSYALEGLLRLGLEPDQAESAIRDRWPMLAADVPDETRARGLRLSPDDLAAFVADRFPPTFDDGSPVAPDLIGWPASLVDQALTWAVAVGRGEPSSGPRSMTVNEMLASLRSSNANTRTVAGKLLALSLGAGLKIAGTPEEDFEHILKPQLSELIGRAMSGDSLAVDALEQCITTECAALRKEFR